jgi:hypothetical protein
MKCPFCGYEPIICIASKFISDDIRQKTFKCPKCKGIIIKPIKV